MPEGHNSIRKKLELISMYVQFLIQCLIGLNHFISCFSKGLCIRKKKIQSSVFSNKVFKSSKN